MSGCRVRSNFLSQDHFDQAVSLPPNGIDLRHRLTRFGLILSVSVATTLHRLHSLMAAGIQLLPSCLRLATPAVLRRHCAVTTTTSMTSLRVNLRRKRRASQHASQLRRILPRQLPLTVYVEKAKTLERGQASTWSRHRQQEHGQLPVNSKRCANTSRTRRPPIAHT